MNSNKIEQGQIEQHKLSGQRAPTIGATLFLYWLPVVLWAALLFGLSTDSFSSAHTGNIVLAIIHRLLPGASEGTLELLHLVIRKCAHVAEYFVFGFLLLRAIRGAAEGWKLRWAILALIIAGSYGGLDEFHQSFVPSRTASPRDALLDTAGAAMAQIVAWRLAGNTGQDSRSIGAS